MWQSKGFSWIRIPLGSWGDWNQTLEGSRRARKLFIPLCLFIFISFCLSRTSVSMSCYSIHSQFIDFSWALQFLLFCLPFSSALVIISFQSILERAMISLPKCTSLGMRIYSPLGQLMYVTITNLVVRLTIVYEMAKQQLVLSCVHIWLSKNAYLWGQ